MCVMWYRGNGVRKSFLACVMNVYTIGNAFIGVKIIYTNPHNMIEH